MCRTLALRMGLPLLLLGRLMPYAEFLDWSRHFAEEPFDDRRCFDAPAARLASLYGNAHLKEGAKPFATADFMPYQTLVDPQIVDIDEFLLSNKV